MIGANVPASTVGPQTQAWTLVNGHKTVTKQGASSIIEPCHSGVSILRLRTGSNEGRCMLVAWLVVLPSYSTTPVVVQCRRKRAL